MNAPGLAEAKAALVRLMSFIGAMPHHDRHDEPRRALLADLMIIRAWMRGMK